MAIFIGNLVVLCRETRGIKLERKPKLTNHQRREALVRRRTDLNKATPYGPPKLVREGRELPFIIVSPLVPERATWDLIVPLRPNSVMPLNLPSSVSGVSATPTR